MATNNQQPKEENSIETLNSHLTSAGDRIANNKKYIYMTVGIITLAAAFVLGYLFIYRNPHTNAAWEAYNAVEQAAMGNDSIAAAQYKNVADKYSSTDAGNIAYLNAAESLYNLKKYNEAADCIKKFSSKDEVLEANALALLGDCYVNLKKYDDALAAFQKSVRASNSNPQIAPRVLLKEAVVYIELKKYDKALECYETIKKDFPQFQLGNGISIDTYIAREKARAGK